jgi:hypothetical protein
VKDATQSRPYQDAKNLYYLSSGSVLVEYRLYLILRGKRDGVRVLFVVTTNQIDFP